MEPLLYLVHRIPFPPNKGDKIRSYHLLRHLAERYAVHLGTFVDAPEDAAHVPQLESMCASLHVQPLDRRSAKLRSVSGMLTGEALTLPYYRSGSLQAWVNRTVRQHGIRKAIVFSGAMAQYVEGLGLHVVLDFVDVDSAKWREFSERQSWPSSFVYRRESERLLSFERRAAAASAASVFVTQAEAELFARLAPECAVKVNVVEMGVNTDYFCPRLERKSPYADGECAVTFVGAMDYWPNVDAALWFATDVMPRLRGLRPGVKFYVVGMNPVATVQALATSADIVVTGTVPDVRPYLQHASVVVAPLRVARGVQSKVLEAMAMARPVVISSTVRPSLRGEVDREFKVASGAEQFAETVAELLGSARAEAIGQAARERIVRDYSWERNLAAFDRLLDSAAPAAHAGR